MPKPSFPTERDTSRICQARMIPITAETPVARNTYGGHELAVYLADEVATDWYDRPWQLPPELALLKMSRLKSGAKVFDLGAHHGVVAMMLAREVGPAGSVLAVEAHPHNAAVAKANAALNKIGNLHILHAAVSDREGTALFTHDFNGMICDGTKNAFWKADYVEIPSITIDSLIGLYGMPDVIFIDVEGAEARALSGASLAFGHPTDFFVEVHAGGGLEILGNSAADIFGFFDTRQFEIFVRADGEPQFRRASVEDYLLARHFFLVALARS